MPALWMSNLAPKVIFRSTNPLSKVYGLQALGLHCNSKSGPSSPLAHSSPRNYALCGGWEPRQRHRVTCLQGIFRARVCLATLIYRIQCAGIGSIRENNSGVTRLIGVSDILPADPNAAIFARDRRAKNRPRSCSIGSLKWPRSRVDISIGIVIRLLFHHQRLLADRG